MRRPLPSACSSAGLRARVAIRPARRTDRASTVGMHAAAAGTPHRAWNLSLRARSAEAISCLTSVTRLVSRRLLCRSVPRHDSCSGDSIHGVSALAMQARIARAWRKADDARQAGSDSCQAAEGSAARSGSDSETAALPVAPPHRPRARAPGVSVRRSAPPGAAKTAAGRAQGGGRPDRWDTANGRRLGCRLGPAVPAALPCRRRVW